MSSLTDLYLVTAQAEGISYEFVIPKGANPGEMQPLLSAVFGAQVVGLLCDDGLTAVSISSTTDFEGVEELAGCLSRRLPCVLHQFCHLIGMCCVVCQLGRSSRDRECTFCERKNIVWALVS